MIIGNFIPSYIILCLAVTSGGFVKNATAFFTKLYREAFIANNALKIFEINKSIKCR